MIPLSIRLFTVCLLHTSIFRLERGCHSDTFFKYMFLCSTVEARNEAPRCEGSSRCSGVF